MEENAQLIVDAAKKVQDAGKLNNYNQILEQIPNASRELKRDLKILQEANNVTLK